MIRILTRCSLILLILSGCERTPPPLSSHRHAAVGLYDAMISADGRHAIVASVNHGVGYWELDKQELLFEWRHGSTEGGEDNSELPPADIVTVAISPDSRVAGTATQKEFALWDTQSGKSRGFWSTPADIRDMALANNGKHVALALSNHIVMYINMQTGRRVEISGHGEVVNAVSMSPNGRYLLSCGNDYRAILWDTKNVKPVFIWEHADRVTQIAMSMDGRYALSAGVKGDVKIWSLKNGSLVSQLAMKQREYTISAAVFSPDNRYVLTGSAGRNLILWDLESGTKVDQWQVSKRKVNKPTGAIVYGLGFNSDASQALSEASSGFFERWTISERLLKQAQR